MIGERTERTTNETPLSDNTAGHCTPSKKYNVGKHCKHMPVDTLLYSKPVLIWGV